MARVGRVAIKSIIYFEIMTTVALIIGLVAVNVLRPGVGMNVDVSTLDAHAVEPYVKLTHEVGAFKAGHELITVGPYCYLRHPIYTGILLMTLGVALSFGTLGACLGYLLIFISILLKLRDEEALLSEHFPADYPAYRERTRMILPFLW